MSNRVNYGGRAASAAGLVAAGAAKISDALDYEAVAPSVTLTAGTDRIYLSHCPVLLFLTHGVRINVPAAGNGAVTVQVYAANLPLFAAPVAITGETTLFPVESILEARRSIPAGARLEVRVVSITTGPGYSVWRGLRVAFLLRDPDASVTVPALEILSHQIAEAQQDADIALGSLSELARGGVLLRRDGRDTVPYVPAADSDAGRMQALKAALQEAALDPALPATIELLNGRFGIPAGQPLSSWLAPYATHVSIVFGQCASVLYADETDAGEDWRLYPGNERQAKHFGAVRDVSVDSQPMIQAALFSLRASGSPVEPIAKYPQLALREGVVYLEMGPFMLGDTLYMTGYQQLIGMGGRPVQLRASETFAPESGPIKYLVYTANYWVSGVLGPHFNFDIRVLNITLANTFPGNTKVAGILYGCGQGGLLDIQTSGMGYVGIELRGGTSHVIVRHWGISNDANAPNPALPIQRGPHILGASLHSVYFEQLSEEFLNNDPANPQSFVLGADTVDLACVMIRTSTSLRFGAFVGESNGALGYFANCNSTTFETVNHTGAELSGHGRTLLTFKSCVYFSWKSIVARHFAKLVEVIGVGAGSIDSDNSPFFQAGPHATTGRVLSRLGADPGGSQLAPNTWAMIKNLVTGKVRMWFNDDGDIRSFGED